MSEPSDLPMLLPKTEILEEALAEEKKEVTDGVVSTADLKKVMPATSDARLEVSGEEMSAQQKKTIRALVGNAKAVNSRIFSGHKNKNEKIMFKGIDRKATIVFVGCEDSEYILTVFRCEKIDAVVHQKIHTCQVDMSDNLNLTWTASANFKQLVWAGCENLGVKFHDSKASIKVAFSQIELMAKKKGTLDKIAKERTQHVVKFRTKAMKELINSMMVRHENGYPTTLEELDTFKRRQESTVQAMAKNLGITIKPSKKKIGTKGRKPNAPCHCGSGKKYKKCCLDHDITQK